MRPVKVMMAFRYAFVCAFLILWDFISLSIQWKLERVFYLMYQTVPKGGRMIQGAHTNFTVYYGNAGIWQDNKIS